MEIALIVLRSAHAEKLIAFYALLGMHFEYHKHGNSPYHYSGKVDKSILEIYPLAKTQTEADSSLRLGFRFDNFENVVKDLQEAGVSFSSEPATTDWGTMAVVSDPDGRKIEIYKK
ncbi:MAG: VOC family protein [Cytophagaceae bacterium]